MHKQIAAVVIALFTYVTSCSAAQSPAQFPVKPVGLVTPYPPGGGTDAVARPVAGSFSRAWDQSIVVDNRGGGGVIAAQMVAKTPPDGYTLFLSSGGVIKTQNLKF